MARSSIKILGHIISENGIELDPDKVKALVLLPPLGDLRQLHTFLQKTKYLSRFIPMLSQILYPLQKLTRRVTFQWSEECNEVFEAVKELLGSVSSVKTPDFSKDRKSTRLNSSHSGESRMPSSA